MNYPYYVVSHSGTMAGPFEAFEGVGEAAASRDGRYRCGPDHRTCAEIVVRAIRDNHPNARVILVRSKGTSRKKMRDELESAAIEWLEAREQSKRDYQGACDRLISATLNLRATR